MRVKLHLPRAFQSRYVLSPVGQAQWLDGLGQRELVRCTATMRELTLWIVLPCLALQGDPELEAQRWIKQLRSDRIDDREAAVRELKRIGMPALPQLEAARDKGDLELASRARELLSAIRAEHIFREIEGRIEKAGTLKVSVKGVGMLKPGAGPDQEQELRGSALVKDGNKAHLQFSLKWSDSSLATEKISDGSKLRYSEGNGRTLDCPKVVGRNVRVALVRAGALLGFVRGLGGKAWRVPVCEDPALTDTLAVSNF